MSTNVNYSSIKCQGQELFIGAKVYHYIYGEMIISKIERVRTKFEQFNYVEARIQDRSTMSEIFVEKYGLTNTLTISFREDYINDWLFLDKDSVVIKNEEYANSIYLK